MIEVSLRVQCCKCKKWARSGQSFHPFPDTGIVHGVFTLTLPEGWQRSEDGPTCPFCSKDADARCYVVRRSWSEGHDWFAGGRKWVKRAELAKVFTEDEAGIVKDACFSSYPGFHFQVQQFKA